MEHTQISVTARSMRKIEHVYVHPDYNPMTYDNNIAVMEVDQLIPVDDHWTRPVFLPKTPFKATASSGKLNIAFPVDTTLKPYIATIMSDDACAQINGNANVSTNTLMCIDGLCSEHECDRFVSFCNAKFRLLFNRIESNDLTTLVIF